MQAGDLKNVIVLKSKASTRDAFGGEVITRTSVATVCAKAKPMRGREFMQLAQADVEIDVSFTIYYRTDVDATWSVSWRDKEYDIVAPPIDIEAEQKWLELMCRTV